MKRFIFTIVPLFLFLLIAFPASACTEFIMQPNPSYLNERTDFTLSGTANNVSSIWLVYGYQQNESNFFVDIPGWTCINARCSGAAYTGTYTIHLTIDSPSNGYIGRFADNVFGQCPMDPQTVIARPTPPPIPGDANGDNNVDETDYSIWRSHRGQSPTGGIPDGDFNIDGKVDGIDYSIWVLNFNP